MTTAVGGGFLLYLKSWVGIVGALYGQILEHLGHAHWGGSVFWTGDAGLVVDPRQEVGR